MITIINYGLGNIQAFANIYRRLNIPVTIATSADDLKDADRIILPGVGAFDWAMTLLNRSGMRVSLEKLVLEKSRPVLGICVGMQIMAKRSDEGVLAGLGWIDAEVKRFDEAQFTNKIRLPHMGWNNVKPKAGDYLFQGLEVDSRFYFLHSYYFAPHKETEIIAATDYNHSFSSAVRSKNICGVQFHPEKSHQWGIQLLKNFAEL